MLPLTSTPNPFPTVKPPTTAIQKVAHVRRANQRVDLDTHTFGLYAYYAEGRKEDYSGEQYDPYYGETDIKDPALLERAKKYFESLLNMEAEEDEQYELRSAIAPTVGHKHLPMYQRKRRKIKKLVILSKKVYIEPSLKQYLLSVYPLDQIKRWNTRGTTSHYAPGYTSSFLMREEKLKEIISQVRAGFEIPRPGPHSLKTDINLRNFTSAENFSENLHVQSSSDPSNSLLPCPTYIKSEPIDYTEYNAESNHANHIPFVKQEPHHVCVNIKQEPVEPTDTRLNSVKNKRKKLKKPFEPFPIVKEEPIEEEESHMLDNINKDIHDASKSPGSDEKESDFSIKVKQEPLDETQMEMVEIFRKRVHKLKKIEVVPMVSDMPEIKEEPLDMDDVGSSQISPEPQRKEFSHPSSTKRAPKFVYGKRVRARMGFSRQRTMAADAEVEFDEAAQISTLFSPPKSCWSRKVPTRVRPKMNPKRKKRDKLTLQIDQLITDGNIETLEETEQMYQLFAETIKSNTDRHANVFNIVLEKFKQLKKDKDDATKSLTEEEEEKPCRDREDTSCSEESDKLKVIFPMDDHEIYGVTVIKESVAPGKFETPSIKKEMIDEEECENAVAEEPVCDKDNNVPEVDKDIIKDAPADAKSGDSYPDDVSDRKTPPHSTPLYPSETSEVCSSETLLVRPEANSGFRQLQSHSQSSSSTPACGQEQAHITSSESPFSSVVHSRPHNVYNNFYKPYLKSVKQNFQKQQYRSEFMITADHTTRSDAALCPNMPTGIHEQPKNVTESDRLFDEILPDEMTHFPNADTSYLEQYVRNDNVLSSAALDDFIKGPLSSNEHLIKPKPSYGRMSYHSDDSLRGPHPASLYPVRSDEMQNKDSQEWHTHWKKQNEAFDHFPNASWPIEEQSTWNLSWSEPIFEQTTVSSNSSLEDQNDSRKFSMNLPIIERAPSGEEILKIPVNLRTVKTQFPLSDKKFSPIETSLPYVMYIPQRQDSVADIGTQTEGPPLKRYRTWLGQRPLSAYSTNSVLVESMPKGANIAQTTSAQLNTSDESSDRQVISLRTVQTQFPGVKQGQFEFKECETFFIYRNSQTKESSPIGIQTDGQSLYPPWVAPGRFRRHRPVLVEPLPNIEPIGDNVRTMRSSDAYSILMEQIRTSNESSFDRFMNSQHQPNGITDSLNQHACYSPQAPNVRQLPLTVNKNYSKKSSAIGKGKRPGIHYKEVAPQPSPPPHSNMGKCFNNNYY